MPDEKGKFSTEIGADVIKEALKSVAKAKGEEVPVEVEAPQAVPPPAGDPKDKEIEQLKAQLEFSMTKGRELMEKVKDSHERMLRAVADLENYRKRAQKEKEEVQKFGVERLLKDFLPVIDNFDRALEHAKSADDTQSLLKGIQMTRKLFEDTMSKYGVRPFSAVGKPFDPRLHEAMQQVETADVPPNQVLMEVVRGYMLNDRLMRPALVSVSKPLPAPAPPAEGAAQQAPPAEGAAGETASPSGGETGATGVSKNESGS